MCAASLYFSAKSCSDEIISNVGFNGPRAFINLNDGFGGNTTIAFNNIWNTCRESGDHGPINVSTPERSARRACTATWPDLLKLICNDDLDLIGPHGKCHDAELGPAAVPHRAPIRRALLRTDGDECPPQHHLRQLRRLTVLRH
jgi:hypothetical protein